MRFQPAHQSMINRRHDGRASRFARQSLQQMLERKPRIYLPATCKGGHESGTNHPLGTRFGGRLATLSGHSAQRNDFCNVRRLQNAGLFDFARSMWLSNSQSGAIHGLGDVNAEFAIPGQVRAVAAANDLIGNVQFMFATADGHLWHTLRRADGTWTGLGDVNAEFAIPGPVEAIAAAIRLDVIP